LRLNIKLKGRVQPTETLSLAPNPSETEKKDSAAAA
jgi:hypothetical protein